jgi:hypothetical protein
MRRWVVIEDGWLRVSNRENGTVLRIVSLDDVEAIVAARSSKKFSFECVLATRELAFAAETEADCQRWIGVISRIVELNKRFRENVRRAVLCFLAIRRFRGDECEHVGAASKDVTGIIVGMVWKSQFDDRRLWLF